MCGAADGQEIICAPSNDLRSTQLSAASLRSSSSTSCTDSFSFCLRRRAQTGFTIHRKEESGAWEEFAVNSDLRTYTFRDRECESRYSLSEHHTADTIFSLVFRYFISSTWHISRLAHNATLHHTTVLCGTKYQLYISAHNEAGNGLPSNTIQTKTQGTGSV